MTNQEPLSHQKHRQQVHLCECSTCREHPSGRVARQHRAFNRLLVAADERTRRLLAGFMARQYGRGGISLVAQITGLDRNTVARGRRELRHPARWSGWVRRPGGGRLRTEKKAWGS